MTKLQSWFIFLNFNTQPALLQSILLAHHSFKQIPSDFRSCTLDITMFIDNQPSNIIMLLVIKYFVSNSHGKCPCTHACQDYDEYNYSSFWITGCVSFECSHVTITDGIGVSEASKCMGINYLSYCVTFLYLRWPIWIKRGTMSPNFLVELYMQSVLWCTRSATCITFKMCVTWASSKDF